MQLNRANIPTPAQINACTDKINRLGRKHTKRRTSRDHTDCCESIITGHPALSGLKRKRTAVCGIGQRNFGEFNVIAANNHSAPACRLLEIIASEDQRRRTDFQGHSCASAVTIHVCDRFGLVVANDNLHPLLDLKGNLVVTARNAVLISVQPIVSQIAERGSPVNN